MLNRATMWIAFVLCAAAHSAFGDAQPARRRVDYSREIRPILTQHCWNCHGPDENTREADLRLDQREVAINLRAIVPGDAKASKLVTRICSDKDSKRMPPPEFKKPLNDSQKELLKAWIEEGADFAQHWAFTAPERSDLPAVKDATWSRNPIDAYVLNRLEQEGLRPSAEADKATVLRRVTLDVTGVPPTLDELDAFLADRSPDAYEKVVDRLLRTPRYAERMAMGWLDAARYADTNGFNNDEDRSQWPWRDWVIDAFARNMPFDRFIVEQLAGDLLPESSLDQKIATAFLRNQVYNTEGGIIQEEYHVEYVADRVHTASTVFLGLSMQCARCHDHKFDPITQKEYYQFYAFFNSVAEKPASYVNFVAAEPFVRVPSVRQREDLAELERLQADCERRIKQREADVDAPQALWEQSLSPYAIRRISRADLALGLALDEMKGEDVHDTVDSDRRGTVRGTTNWTVGKKGGALEFDGNTFVDLGQGASFDADEAFSIGAWTFPTSNESLAVVSKMDDAAANRGYDVLLEGGKVEVHLIHRWPENAIKVIAKESVSLNARHHLLVTYSGSRKASGVKVYVDGKPVDLDTASDTLTGTIRTDRSLHLGKRQTSLGFKGKLDDVRFFRLELPADDAAKLASGQDMTPIGSILASPVASRSPEQRQRLRAFFLSQIDDVYPRLKHEAATRVRERDALEKSFAAVMVMKDLPEPRETHLLNRGQYDQPSDKVDPGVPGVFGGLQTGLPPNRLGLAQWLVDPKHPLTARVAVNRWWQSYFGTGLVKTVEDFGTTGEAPSHRGLLDFLALELIRSGWDVRHLQRLIVTSATYRQSSQITPELREKDPENRLLARGPRNRLTAEGVRDNALAISGLMRDRVGGPSVKPYQPPGLWEDVTVERRGHYVADKGDGLYRRSMYTFWKRTCPPPTLMSFDAPNREVCVARRAVTNTPLQALVLLNDPTYVEASRKLADRMIAEGGDTPEGRLTIAFRCALSRPPAAEEQRILLAIYKDARDRFEANRDGAKTLLAVGESPSARGGDAAELAAWTTVASMILNLDETISKR